MDCLLRESALHGDLLIVKQRDSYRGLVYKVLMAFRYLVSSYPNAHLVKIDKDCVLDINKVFQVIVEVLKCLVNYFYVQPNGNTFPIRICVLQ